VDLGFRSPSVQIRPTLTCLSDRAIPLGRRTRIVPTPGVIPCAVASPRWTTSWTRAPRSDILDRVAAGSVQVRRQECGSGPICREVLGALPAWFGIEEAIDDYAAVADRSPTEVASVGGKDVGFLTVVLHSPYAAEIHVMGVLPDYHRQGIGAELLRHAEESLAVDGVEYLQVKTLSANKEHDGYERTRAFYLASGFRPLEELPGLWGQENPALQMVKGLSPERRPRSGGPLASDGSYAARHLLVLVTGVPGTGKSRVADAAGQQLAASVLAHDWAMSGLRPYPGLQQALDVMDPSGHRVVGWSILCALARSELRRDRSVVLDGVARREEIDLCRRLANEEGSRLLLVATECSNLDLHRQRVEGRQRSIPGWYELGWDQVAPARANWEAPSAVDLVLDTARPWEENAAQLRSIIGVAAGRTKRS
jgi:predicted kinase/ribosomal protein S18 acetylase RimI-like enzyme